jgi:hypothetical protein
MKRAKSLTGCLKEIKKVRSEELLTQRAEQIVGRERREREVIADFQLPIVDLIRAAASTPPLGCAVTEPGAVATGSKTQLTCNEQSKMMRESI